MNGDSISLRNVRPDRTETAVPNLLPSNAFTITNASTTVSVNEPNHGRSTSDTVRFRDASNIANLPAATINASGGYTITKGIIIIINFSDCIPPRCIYCCCR